MTPSNPGSSPTMGSAVPIGGATPGGPYKPGDVAIGSTVLPNSDARLSSLKGLVDQTAGSLANVDRTKLAQNEWDAFAKSTDPAYQASLRDATRSAAAAGRIGSGMLRTSYGNLADQRALQLDTAKQNLMNNAIEGSIADQFNKLSALSGLEGQQYGEGADTNAQLRQERGYQGSLEQQAFDRALQQYELGQQAEQQQFNQGVTLDELGNAGNPAALYEGAGATGLLGADQLASSLGGLGKAQGSAPTSGGSTSLGGIDLSTLANWLGHSQDENAKTTAGQGIDMSGIEKLLGIGG